MGSRQDNKCMGYNLDTKANEMTFVMRYVVREAGFRKKLVEARKLADGSVNELFEPIGYFVVLDPGGLAFRLGDEDVHFTKGEAVELVLRRAR
jgi:hypothetical protein